MEMSRIVLKELESQLVGDVLFLTMAVTDWRG